MASCPRRWKQLVGRKCEEEGLTWRSQSKCVALFLLRPGAAATALLPEGCMPITLRDRALLSHSLFIRRQTVITKPPLSAVSHYLSRAGISPQQRSDTPLRSGKQRICSRIVAITTTPTFTHPSSPKTECAPKINSPPLQGTRRAAGIAGIGAALVDTPSSPRRALVRQPDRSRRGDGRMQPWHWPDRNGCARPPSPSTWPGGGPTSSTSPPKQASRTP